MKEFSVEARGIRRQAVESSEDSLLTRAQTGLCSGPSTASTDSNLRQAKLEEV